MSQGGGTDRAKSKAKERAERLKAALKANMGRRKAQARARRTADQDTKGGHSPHEESS